MRALQRTLYCLGQVDIAQAVEGSKRVLEAGGHWWSVQLACHILEHSETEPA